MIKTKEQLQRVIMPAERFRLARGEHVEMYLDTGEVVDGTITALRSRSAVTTRMAARSKKWNRWSGTPEDLVQIVNRASTEIGKLSRETPPVSIRIELSDHDEERYSDVSTFEHDMRADQSGAPGARLRDIDAIELSMGPTQRGSLKAKATFSRSLTAPGVELALEGEDRTVVRGLKEELAPIIEAGRPRVPALPVPVHMLVGGLAGFAYSAGIRSVNWDFMPNGWVGDLLFTLLYLSGLIALIYGVSAGMKSLVPQLTLVHPGQKTHVQEWKPRIVKVIGSLSLASLPFILQRFLG